MILKRDPRNPILTRHDIPPIAPHLTDVTAVFNPGAVKFQDKYLLMLRVQNRGRETYLMTAQSDDGIDFQISDRIIQFNGVENLKETVYHIYDPRITEIGGTYFVMVAMDMESGCRLGLARTVDFADFEFVGIVSEEDNRNGVLFPEIIDGKHYRFDRPNTLDLWNGPTTGNTIYLSSSTDLKNWKRIAPLMRGRPHYWDELIGSGPPPIKTAEGWLHIYHGVATHLSNVYIYQAGVVLIDLGDLSKVKARSKYNILEPREPYELTGQVPNVVFPTGMIVEEYDSDGFASSDSKVLIYYGAADTSVCLATTTVRELIESCQYL